MKKKHYAVAYGEQIARNMFYRFYNHPEYRGPAFEWDSFRIERWAEIQVDLNTRQSSDRTMKMKRKLAGEAARIEWNRLCVEHGLKDEDRTCQD